MTFFSGIPSWALTFARESITAHIVSTAADVDASFAPAARGAGLLAHLSVPAGGATAASVHRRAVGATETGAGAIALRAPTPAGTVRGTTETRAAGRTSTFPRDLVALDSSHVGRTIATLFAILAVLAVGTGSATVGTGPSWKTEKNSSENGLRIRGIHPKVKRR